jgi:hypothetical protein
MENPNTFEEASAATEQMFEQPSEPVAPTAAETPVVEETPVSEGDAAAALENATQTAEIAAQTAAEKNSELEAALAEIEALKAQNQQLEGTIHEMSRHNEEALVETALAKPTLNINDLAFADDDTQNAAVEKFAEDLAAYTRAEIMKEMEPALGMAKKAQADEVVTALSSIPELNGIKDMKPHLDNIIAGSKWLSSPDVPLEEKYINAYAMARGIEAMNTPVAPHEPPKQPSTEELMALYNGNPEFRELIERQRISEVSQSQQVPPFSASSGAVNAALDIKAKPQTLEEASERTRMMFGL